MEQLPALAHMPDATKLVSLVRRNPARMGHEAQIPSGGEAAYDMCRTRLALLVVT